MSLITCDLRRSCTFCRQRKMKCSGESPWCKTCKERAQPCVYETAGPKGRPRRPLDLSQGYGYDTLEFAGGYHALSSSPSELLGEVIRDLFTALWSPRGQLAEKAEALRARVVPAATASGQVGEVAMEMTLPYEGTMMLMLYECMELLTGKLSPLGHAQLRQTQPSRFAMALVRDTSVAAMPEELSIRLETRKPLKFLDQRRVADLIDFAYAEHPLLSIITSKTLFQREFLAETNDPCLTNVIVAEAITIQLLRQDSPDKFLEATQMAVTNDDYYAEAFAILNKRCRRSSDEQERIATAQAALLLAWNLLYTGQIKRALVLFTLVSEMVRAALAESHTESLSSSSRVNGFPIDQIEAELLYNMHWIVQSVGLWASLHLDTSIPALWTPRFEAHYPPLDLYDSVVWKLDAISGYLSATPKQAEAIRKVRILTHAYGLASYIYKVISQDDAQDAPQTNQHTRSQQVLSQLHCCLSRISQEAMQAVPPTHRDSNGYEAVKIFHELIAIRILLECASRPDSSEWPPPRAEIGSETVLAIFDFCRSLADQAEQMSSACPMSPTGFQDRTDILVATERARARARSHSEAPLYLKIGTPPGWCTTLMVLAIDSCVRALEVLLVKSALLPCALGLTCEVEGLYQVGDSVQHLIRQEASRVRWLLGRFLVSLRSGTFECGMRRDVKRHCKALVKDLAARGIGTSAPPLQSKPIAGAGSELDHTHDQDHDQSVDMMSCQADPAVFYAFQDPFANNTPLVDATKAEVEMQDIQHPSAAAHRTESYSFLRTQRSDGEIQGSHATPAFTPRRNTVSVVSDLDAPDLASGGGRWRGSMRVDWPADSGGYGYGPSSGSSGDDHGPAAANANGGGIGLSSGSEALVGHASERDASALQFWIENTPQPNYPYAPPHLRWPTRQPLGHHASGSGTGQPATPAPAATDTAYLDDMANETVVEVDQHGTQLEPMLWSRHGSIIDDTQHGLGGVAATGGSGGGRIRHPLALASGQLHSARYPSSSSTYLGDGLVARAANGDSSAGITTAVSFHASDPAGFSQAGFGHGLMASHPYSNLRHGNAQDLKE